MTIRYSKGNIYDLRFKILAFFYEIPFFRRNVADEGSAVEYCVRVYDIPDDQFIIANVEYLIKSGYLGNEKGVIAITQKGIKFIELITEGELSFGFEEISRDTLGLIKRKFREQDD